MTTLPESPPHGLARFTRAAHRPSMAKGHRRADWGGCVAAFAWAWPAGEMLESGKESRKRERGGMGVGARRAGVLGQLWPDGPAVWTARSGGVLSPRAALQRRADAASVGPSRWTSSAPTAPRKGENVRAAGGVHGAPRAVLRGSGVRRLPSTTPGDAPLDLRSVDAPAAEGRVGGRRVGGAIGRRGEAGGEMAARPPPTGLAGSPRSQTGPPWPWAIARVFFGGLQCTGADRGVSGRGGAKDGRSEPARRRVPAAPWGWATDLVGLLCRVSHTAQVTVDGRAAPGGLRAARQGARHTERRTGVLRRRAAGGGNETGRPKAFPRGARGRTGASGRIDHTSGHRSME